jgi:hypothetical protein
LQVASSRKACYEMEKPSMARNGVTSSPRTTVDSTRPRRRNLYVSGMAVRVLIALVISWLIVMAFFITTVASH